MFLLSKAAEQISSKLNDETTAFICLQFCSLSSDRSGVFPVTPAGWVSWGWTIHIWDGLSHISGKIVQAAHWKLNWGCIHGLWLFFSWFIQLDGLTSSQDGGGDFRGVGLLTRWPVFPRAQKQKVPGLFKASIFNRHTFSLLHSLS